MFIYMYSQIINILIGFHTCSHFSFALTKHYPKYYQTNYYFLLGTSDLLTHFLLYYYENSYLAGFWLVWHVLKALDKSKYLRSKTLINWLEAFSYLYLFNYKYPYSIYGLGLYIPFRYFDLSW
jgi:hypothetical protein